MQGGTERREADASVDLVDPPTFRPRIIQLAAVAHLADLSHFTTLSGERKWQQIVARASLPIASRITDGARRLVADLLVACTNVGGTNDEEPPFMPAAFLSFEMSMDAVVHEVQHAGARARATEDIAFLVQIELRQRHERLARLTDCSDAMTVIGECDSALRRVRKGLTAINVTLGPETTPAVAFRSELAASLLVRRAYARACRYFAHVVPTTPEAIDAALRGASARLDSLVEGEVAPLLRVRDRLQILELTDRVRSYLATDGGSDSLVGQRLWQDVCAFFGMLSQISRRQELIEHDSRVIGALLSDFPTPQANALPGALITRLQELEGLDDELDQLLARPDHGRAAPLREVLERLGVRFGVACDGAR